MGAAADVAVLVVVVVVGVEEVEVAEMEVDMVKEEEGVLIVQAEEAVRT